MTKEKIDKIARVSYEANRAYCIGLGDYSFLPWEEAEEWQKETHRQGVIFNIENPLASPSAAHDSWLEEKVNTGWVYGQLKDAEAKTHPCMVPYEQLPEDQKRKDSLFVGIVKALAE